MEKLQTIELKEYEIVEIDGEFHKKEINSERHALYFTNRALRIGRELDLLEKGLEEELFNMMANLGPEMAKKAMRGNDIDAEDVIGGVGLPSMDHMKNIIWLAYVGAKQNEYLELEDFKEFYQESYEIVMQTYVDILTTNFKSKNTKNQYRASLAKSVAKTKGKK